MTTMCRRLAAPGSHFTTSYQRDTAVTSAADQPRDDVGTATRRRGKRTYTAPTAQPAPMPYHTDKSFLAPKFNSDHTSFANAGVGRPAATQAGHIAGYTGHVPKARPYQYSQGGPEQQRSHDKSFYLPSRKLQEAGACSLVVEPRQLIGIMHSMYLQRLHCSASAITRAM